MEVHDSSSSYLTGWRLGTVITCLFFGTFLIALDTNILNVAIPTISTDFHTLDDVAWYGTAYLVTLTAFQPIYGTLYKFFDTTIVYKAAILVFEVGSILCATAASSPMFIIGRAIAGLGAAGLFQGALSILSQVVPLGKRPMYMGIVISVFAVATSAAPPLGGAFTEHATWRWCFWINLPIGAAVLALLSIFLRIQTTNELRKLSLSSKLRHMDPLGCVLFLGDMCCLLFALQWGGQTKPWNSPTVIGLLVGFLVLTVVFIGVQHKLQDRALIPLRVFQTRSIWTGACVLFFLGGAIYLTVFFLPIYFQAIHGVGAIQSGVNLIPFFLPQITAVGVLGFVVKQWGHYVPYMLAGEVVGVAGIAMLTRLQPTTPVIYWASGMVVSGIGIGMAMQLPYTAVQITLSDEDIPTGNAIAVLFFQLGGVVSISLGQTITITTIIPLVAKNIPNLSSQAIIDAGAAGLTLLASSPGQLELLLAIWNEAIRRTMLFALSLVAASIPFTAGMEWLNAKKIAAAQTSGSLELTTEAIRSGPPSSESKDV